MLAELADQIAEARAKSARLKRVVEAMVLDTGSGPTWPQLEAEMGVPAGQGQTVYNLITGCDTALNNVSILLMTDRLEQG
jgi:hypothetical protein